MEEAKFIELVEEILEVDSGSVTPNSNLEEIDWDSLANISLIAEVDSKLGVSIDAERIAKSETVADLYALINEATNSK